MPDLSALWAEPFPIPPHALLALAALLVGALQLIMPKGTGFHRGLGYFWSALMVGTALTALFIHDLQVWGLFSPIHLLVPLTLAGLWQGINFARQGDIQRHRRVMLQLFYLALIVAGLFTLLPGRAMHAVIFGGV